jgi:hypothetical protein
MAIAQDQPASQPLTFLRLPTELRLEIYKYLLLPFGAPSDAAQHHDHPQVARQNCLAYYQYERHSQSPHSAFKLPILGVRILDPNIPLPSEEKARINRRKRFAIRNHYRGRTQMTTYAVLKEESHARISANDVHIETTFLATCKQIHSEAAHLLYSSYHFDFSTHVEAIEPFFSDLTPQSRSYVRSISITKRALPYDRDFDLSEWTSATHYIATQLPGLRSLDLGVVAGKPPHGWDEVPDFTAQNYECWVKMRGWEASGLKWIKEVLRCTVAVPVVRPEEFKPEAKKRKSEKRDVRVTVRSIVEACPPPSNSERLAFWVGLSKSLDSGFTEWVQGLVEEGVWF